MSLQSFFSIEDKPSYKELMREFGNEEEFAESFCYNLHSEGMKKYIDSYIRKAFNG